MENEKKENSFVKRVANIEKKIAQLEKKLDIVLKSLRR
jgi:hypothetical protein